MTEKILQIGIVGAGGFAQFASSAFLKIPGVKIVAIADINESAAEQMALELSAKTYLDYEAFLKDDGIDLVYISTPPFLHYQQSKMALMAGKHVICEKPAALHALEAEELTTLANSLQLLYVVNLMQRYNPLYAIVKRIIQERLLGNFLHGFFENYASDENLPPNHWFWDETRSGGIFIEHGVHFFDMFSGWLGQGQVVNAIQLQRPYPAKNIFDRLQATILYDGGIVNFYHSFDQPKILDRQEMRLQFERGEITLYEWVPVKMKLHGLFSSQQLKKLSEMLGNFSIERHQEPGGISRKSKGRFKEIVFDDHVTIEYGNAREKQARYQEILIAMLTDQWAWLQNRAHNRVIDSGNAVQSLRIAEQATQLAKKIQSG